jgi:histidine triad (HIT) family protein
LLIADCRLLIGDCRLAIAIRNLQSAISNPQSPIRNLQSAISNPQSAMTKCPYCTLTDFEQRIVFRRDLVLFLQDERFQGSLKHSGVIIPVAHRATVFDLTEEEIVATFRLLTDVKRWMDGEFRPAGYNVGWNCGTVGGQELFHAHMHVMPRFTQEPLAGQGIRSLLKSAANRW